MLHHDWPGPPVIRATQRLNASGVDVWSPAVAAASVAPCGTPLHVARYRRALHVTWMDGFRDRFCSKGPRLPSAST
jgi:hypothetical protein